MANKINCRCYRCSKKISDKEIKSVGVRIDTDENAFTFCSECVKALDAFINGDDVALSSNVTVTVEKDKVENLVQKTVENAIDKFEKREAKKELTASRTPVPMNELDKLDKSENTEERTALTRSDVFNIQSQTNGRFIDAKRILESNNIPYTFLEYADNCVRTPWGVLQISIEDYPKWRDLWDKHLEDMRAFMDSQTSKRTRPAVKVEKTEKSEKSEKSEVDDKFPPVKKEDVPFRNRSAFNKGGVRCWNLIYLILRSDSTLDEVSEAYSIKRSYFNNMCSPSYNEYARVNKYESYNVKDAHTIRSLRQFAEDNGVRYEDLTCVREIQGPFDELYFKPAPDKAVLDENPVIYN